MTETYLHSTFLGFPGENPRESPHQNSVELVSRMPRLIIYVIHANDAGDDRILNSKIKTTISSRINKLQTYHQLTSRTILKSPNLT